MVATAERSMTRRQCLTALALVGTVAGDAVFAQSQTKKAPHPDVGSGRVAWFDITTTDFAASKAFYGALFGWTFTAVQGAAADQVAEIVSGNQPIGTLRVADGQIAPFNGVVYIQVSDLAASCKKATALGGKIVPGFPFNLTDRPGAIALLADPSGHPVGMYSRTPLTTAK